MKFYPAYLDLHGRPCLLIGGGQVAERKAATLLRAGASVTVISPRLTPKLRQLSESGTVAWREKEFEEGDLEGFLLVFAASDSAGVNRDAARACRGRNVLVNVAAPPEESTFIVPSIVERGDLLLAVSTCGSSPALAKKLREELESRYGPEYDQFLRILSELRRRIQTEIPDEKERKRIYRTVIDADVVELLRQGKGEAVKEKLWKIAGLRHRS
jgi:precorrin-2 dehydrogenase/sirohydrochlorin ferrochelatase